jgi:hypothetical protein
MYENSIQKMRKVEEKHSLLTRDVNHWMDTTVKRSMQRTYAKLMKGAEDSENKLDKLKKKNKTWEDEKIRKWKMEEEVGVHLV